MGLFKRKKKVEPEEIAEILARHALDPSYRQDAMNAVNISEQTKKKVQVPLLALQWYASYLTIVGLSPKLSRRNSEELSRQLGRMYVSRYSDLLEEAFPGITPDKKIDILQKTQDHRSSYDQFVQSGLSMQLGGAIHSEKVGKRFANLSEADDSEFSQVRELGTRLFQSCMEACVRDLSDLKV
ncbi:hypothetical protein GF402_01300 [Candidatus Fermentibacteria bacterium]|nr:hypothetical protein [Candidatus Fermentibacteria bacterium]